MLSRSLLHKLSRFIGVGATATLLQYAILFLLVEALGAALASAIGFVVSAVANYLLNRTFTFGSTLPHRKGAARFVGAVGCGVVLTYGLMQIMTSSGLNYVIAQVLTTAVVALFNFTLGLRWTFK